MLSNEATKGRQRPEYALRLILMARILAPVIAVGIERPTREDR